MGVIGGAKKMMVFFQLDTVTVMMVSEEFEAEPQESEVLIAQVQTFEAGRDSLTVQPAVNISQENSDVVLIEQQTQDSSDTLLHSPEFPQKTHPSAIPRHEATSSPSGQPSDKCGECLQGMSCFDFEHSMQQSMSEFEAAQRMHLQKMRVLYSHFMLKDRALTREQSQQLKAMLYLPSFGESLVQQGNTKYGSSLTVPMAIQRLQQMEAQTERSCSKERCREDVRMLCYLLLLVLLAKLVV